jgi:transposase
MAGALAFRPDRSETALVFQIKEGAYNTESLIEFLTDLREHFGGAKVTLIWDRLPAHKSNRMKAWLAEQRHWLVTEALPGYGHDLNRLELVWATSNKLISPTSARTPSTRHAPPLRPAWTGSAATTNSAWPSSPTPDSI